MTMLAEIAESPKTVQAYWPFWIVAIIDGFRQARTINFMADRGVSLWCPMCYRYRGHGARRVKVQVPVLPSAYIFIPSRFFDSAAVAQAPGFHRFMAVDGALALVRDEQLDPLRKAVEMLNNPEKRAVDGHHYEPGELVRMINGIWQGIITKIESIDNRGSVVLNGGRVGRIRAHVSQIKPAQN